MIQINNIIGYNNLRILQNEDYFKFSLDSVLLANFATVNYRCNRILDLCTGNAPIPLILASKYDKYIIGVELQNEIYNLAIESVKLNKFSDRIEIFNYNVKNLLEYFESDSFDLITCNPPYFKVTPNSIVNQNDIKSIARHEITVKLEDIVFVASNLLKTGGIFSMVHKPDRLMEIIDIMKKYSIEPKRIQLIYPKIGSCANILLIEGIKNGKTGCKIESPLFVYNDQREYTKEINAYLDGNLWRCEDESEKL